jgi:predicted nucleotide-binding protein
MSPEQDGSDTLNDRPVPAPATPVMAVAAPEPPDVFDRILGLVQAAPQTVLFQDVPNARKYADLARGLFEDARAKYGADELAVLGFFCSLVCFYEPLTSALAMSTEGQYKDALSRINEAIQLCDELQQACTQLGKLPDAQEIVAEVEPSLRAFPALLRGSRLSIQAELFGYQGDIKEYVRLLDDAVREYRTVDTLRPSASEGFLQLVQLCKAQADRVEARSRNFQPMLRSVRYLTPSGDKILIIHGQNEKWRELKDFLVQAGRVAMVIEEQLDAGMTLIDKCTKYADQCCFAIALFTPDDMVTKGKKSELQARPNVLFELGWFYGRFGPDRVLILKQEGTGIPSDLAGVLTKNFQTNVKEVIIDIEKELPPPKSQAPAVGGRP